MRDVVFGGLLGRVLLLLEVLVDFARRDVDALDHLALAEQGERQLLAHGVAVARVLDAVLGQHLRQARERNAVALGDVLHGAVQRLVGHLEVAVLGPLHLQLLHHQALQHLLAEHVLGRQFLLGFLETIRQ